MFLASCQSLDAISSESIEIRHLTDGIQELANSSRGAIEVELVDFICGYAIEKDESLCQMNTELCAYFIEYKRSNSNTLNYAVSLVGSIKATLPNGTNMLNESFKDVTLLTSAQQMDRQYASTLSEISSEIDSVLRFSSDDSESDIISGSISKAIINRTMRSINQS